MAKGFTVKANTPKSSTKKKEEFDIAAIKERMKGKTIVFCLPGRGCSFTFLKNFVQLCFDMVQNGMSIQISQDYSSMVNFARCKCLGANVLRGPNQFHGTVSYSMIINCGLTVILSLTPISFGNFVIWQLPKTARRKRLLQVGIVPKMDTLHLLHTGWKKMTSVRTVVL